MFEKPFEDDVQIILNPLTRERQLVSHIKGHCNQFYDWIGIV